MATRAYTPEMAVDLRLPSEPRLSPDSARLAFCVAPAGHLEAQRTSMIYVAPTDGSAQPLPLTDSEHNNVSPRWSPDGATLAFLSDRPKRGEAQLHRVAAAGGEPARLTNVAGGVAAPAWSPAGDLLYVTVRRRTLAGEAESEREFTVTGETPRPRAIAAVAVTGGAPWLIGPAEGHVLTFAVSPDGARFAALVSPTDQLRTLWDHVDLVVFDRDGDNERRLLRLTSFPFDVRWSPDGRQVALIGERMPDPGDDRVFVVDVETGETTALDPRDATPAWTAFQGDDLLVMSVAGQRTRLERADARGSEWDDVALGPAAGGWIDPGSFDVGDRDIALAVSWPNRPTNLYVTSSDGATRPVTNLNPQLEGVALAEMEPLEWRDDEGLLVEGWLLRPPGATGAERLPLIVDVHGGPTGVWGNRFHGTWHDWGQLLAARGFAVLLPNPRGSTGRGAAFTNANRFDFGGRDFQDIMSGIDLLIERGVADPERLGIGGWSYGGFMTAWAVTHSDRFKVAVAGAAPTNWVSKIGTTDISPFNEWNLGQVHREPDKPWERSPVRYLSAVTTPTLVLHGEADKRVPVTQGQEFFQGLRAAGVETEFVTYPRQEHGFHERAAQLDLLQRMLAWFERFLL